MNDMSRQNAAGDDKCTLTIKEVADRYSDSGHPRTIRTLQRYCASGHLESIKIPTQLGDVYLVTPESVERHIAQIEEIATTTRFATGRDRTRPVASVVAPNISDDDPPRNSAMNDDASRSVAVGTRYVAQLEKENVFLHGQIVVKDTQIKDLTERARETNHLIAGLQRMLSPLLGTRRDEPVAGERQVESQRSETNPPSELGG